MVVAEVEDVVAEQAPDDVLRLGPWICSGYASTSESWTSIPACAASPFAYSSTSLSASANQNVFSSSRSMTGSLRIPPSGAVIRTYLPWPTAHALRSRQVSSCAKRKPSGPVTSTLRSTATSQSVTWFSRCQYSASKSSKLIGKSVWL